jgi:HYR domain
VFETVSTVIGPRSRLWLSVAALAGAAGFALALPQAANSGTLNLQGAINFVSYPTGCPPDAPTSVICHSRTGTALVAGLGRVTATYTFMADGTGCGLETFRVLGYPVRLSVAGKGDLNLALREISGCIPALSVPGASPQAITVTGGTGTYAGASGSGTLTRVAGPPGFGVPGTDTWTAAITVPGLEFDLTAPTISGARSKTLSAPRKATRVRVSYNVAASDDRDGTVPVSCRPRSGSRFKLGRTAVRCSATDTSGNTANAAFAVTVRGRR